MYDRTIDDKTLSFEPSGGLMNATLVMRDRETDSWWSIMTSRAIGGALDGTGLTEMPVGEKMTWKEWRTLHPDTKVLSIDGLEHAENNPYENYITGDRTFQGMEAADDRLSAKEPIYTFRLDDAPLAVTHAAVAGGAVFDLKSLEGDRLVFHRPEGASIYLNTVGWRFDPRKIPETINTAELVEALRAGDLPGERLTGFDTYWYSWIGIHANRDTVLLQ